MDKNIRAVVVAAAIVAIVMIQQFMTGIANATVTIPKTWVASETLKAADLNANFSAVKGAIDTLTPDAVPPGTIIQYGGPTTPDGYLKCDGSAVSQTTYAELYTAIATYYNVGGESAGNFRIPHLASMTVFAASGTAGLVTVGTISYYIKF